MTRRIWAWIGLATAAAIGQAGAQATDADDLEPRIAACADCHGAQGRSNLEAYAPSIAGKPEGYLFQQLASFRDGRRQHIVMRQMLAYLSDDYLREIAAYYAAQTPALAARQRDATADVLAIGRALVERGAPERELPACQSCHGADLLGFAPSVPGLLALSSDYLTAQLGAWRAGARHALAPDCMAAVAQRLSVEELGAVTAWIASRPVPADHAPSAVPPGELPLACGSVQ